MAADAQQTMKVRVNTPTMLNSPVSRGPTIYKAGRGFKTRHSRFYLSASHFKLSSRTSAEPGPTPPNSYQRVTPSAT
uniref:Uncharacterized protein n=1 Tax=Knipowitschia caucasica TaxID=637954 RepID=A0AAV2JIF3_KNICA